MAQTPLGPLTVTAVGSTVVRVRYPGEGRGGEAVAVAGQASDAGGVARRAAAQIEEYFSGEREGFDVPVDLGGIDGFQRAVLEAAAEIPFGETASYKEMAITAGSPGAVRAAGTAMGANPVPILIPCHRVIRSDGTAGLYGGGEEMKRWLLDFERAAVTAAAR